MSKEDTATNQNEALTAENRSLQAENSSLLKKNRSLLAENQELKDRLAEAQEANTAKEVFLSNMSHDIRTPMNAIIGMTAIAKKYIDEKARVSDSLNKIEVASSHLLSLINDVLDISRINSGKLSISDTLFSLGDLLHELVIIVRPQMEQKHHSFSFTTDEIRFESLYGDPLRLRQIFVNVINNAVKYTPEGGVISVRISEKKLEDRCLLSFECKDNGTGMTPEFLKKIFEPFERAASTTISRIEGTGLGMSIVKKLIDAMDGTIEIESAPGAGTRILIRIPLRYETLTMNTEQLKDRNLLIIEADEALTDTYRSYLGDIKVSFTIVSSASEAVAALTDADFRNSAFDAVIIGRNIGHAENIFSLAGYLRKAFPALPIILISEHNWDEIEYRAARSGIDHFIPIPFFRKTLVNGLNHALKKDGEQEGFLSTPDLSGKRILLVEDNFINREIAGELLAATRASVDMAEDGSQAVDLFRKSPENYYALILMDIQMPVMDGYTAAEKIRSSGRADAGTVRIYAMTANTFAEDIAKARSAGMDGHIAKPIDINKLMQLLRQVL